MESIDVSVEVDINSLMQRARAAQQHLEGYTQEQVDELITAMVWFVARSGAAEEIAALAVEETRLGNYPEARRAFQETLRSNPSSERAKAGLEYIENRLRQR